MREIEFRGKRIDTGKWVYGGYHEHKPTEVCIGKQPEKQALIIADGLADWNMPVPINAYVVEKETVGQYTGLKDRNGVKIFEGDIVRYGLRAYDDDNNTFIDEPIKSVIEWGGEYPAFDVRGHDFDCNALHGICCQSEYLIEVIGNIHDNSELLDTGKQKGKKGR